MTLLKGVFRYGLPLGERAFQSLDRIRQVYGVRKISFDEKAHFIFVEFDASRLTEQDLTALLRSAGIAIEPRIEAPA